MAFGFQNMTPEGERYFRQLQKLTELEVRVGFQSGEDNYEDGAELVEVAAYNELGGSDRPARPFMKQSFENHENELRQAGQMANDILGNGGSAEQALNRVGVVAKGIVQSEIREGSFAPNAPSTISRKGSSQPLIDTGHMRQSVNYVVKRKGV